MLNKFNRKKKLAQNKITSFVEMFEQKVIDSLYIINARLVVKKIVSLEA